MRIVSFPVINQKLDFRQEIEITFQCPACFAIETLFMEEGIITRTPHWTQVKDRVYHRNCRQPARLINMSRRVVLTPAGAMDVMLRFMRQRRVTPGQLASQVGVSHITVKRWISGRSRPNRTSRERIAGYMGVPLKTIFPQEICNK